MNDSVPSLVRVEVLLDENQVAVLDDIAVRSLQSRSQLLRCALWMSYSDLFRRVSTKEFALLNDDRARYVDRVVELMSAELGGRS